MEYKDDTPKIRVLICQPCESIEEFPPWNGPRRPDGTYDDAMLERALAVHNERHMSYPDTFEFFDIGFIEWQSESVRASIFEEQRKRRGGGSTGFTPEFYATRNTFEDDAMACFKKHNRPAADCQDWLDDSKLLTPDSWRTEDLSGELISSEREILRGLRDSRKKIFLCHYCPVAAHYTTAVRLAKGMYDK